MTTKAAQYAADQELDACCAWLKEWQEDKHAGGIENLRAARRPKPLSLKMKMRLRTKIAGIQPDWVCEDCGTMWGAWFNGSEYIGPTPYYSTFHEGTCGVCGSTASVTEARDYGYLKKGWRQYSESVHLEGSDKPFNEGLA